MRSEQRASSERARDSGLWPREFIRNFLKGAGFRLGLARADRRALDRLRFYYTSTQATPSQPSQASWASQPACRLACQLASRLAGRQASRLVFSAGMAMQLAR